MAVYEKLPTTNLLAVDVRDTLGFSSNWTPDYFDDGAINPYSAWKPVIHPSLHLEGELRKRGAAGDCGLYIPSNGIITASGTSLAAKAAAVKAASVWNWGYNCPNGKVADGQPGRLGDFRGYYHNAPPPIQRVGNSFSFNLAGTMNYLTIRFDLDPDDSDRTLQCYDIQGASGLNLSNTIIACAVYWNGNVATNGNYVGYYEMGNTLVDDGEVNPDATIALTLRNLFSTGSRTCQLYFALHEGGTYKYYPLPKSYIGQLYNQSPATLTVTNDATEGGGTNDPLANIQLSAGRKLANTIGYKPLSQCSDLATSPRYGLQVAANNGLTFRLSLDNTSASSVTYNATIFRLSIWRNGVNDYPCSGLYNASGSSVASITLPANSTGNVFYLDFDEAVGSLQNLTMGIGTIEVSLRRSDVQIFDMALNVGSGSSNAWVSL